MENKEGNTIDDSVEKDLKILSDEELLERAKRAETAGKLEVARVYRDKWQKRQDELPKAA